MACWYTKIFRLIRHIFCENLVKIQQFRHEWLSIMKKRNKNKGPSIICSYIWYINASKCAYINESDILGKFDEDMCYQTQILSIYVIFFSDIGQCFRSAQTKSLENQKTGFVGNFG